jgi:superfamily II DNA/RNA helicase
LIHFFGLIPGYLIHVTVRAVKPSNANEKPMSDDDDSDDDDDDDGRHDSNRRIGKNAFAGLNNLDGSSSESDDETDHEAEASSTGSSSKMTATAALKTVSSSSSSGDVNSSYEDVGQLEQHADEESASDDEIVEFRDLNGRVTRHGSIVQSDVVDTLQGLIGGRGGGGEVDDDDGKSSGNSCSSYRPTEIQRECWTTMLSEPTRDRDVIAISKTGSGKTLAFLVPSLCGLSAGHDTTDHHHPTTPALLVPEQDDHGDDYNNATTSTAAAASSSSSSSWIYPRAIVLAPTRVLAQQIFHVASSMVANTASLNQVRVALVLGGCSYQQQVTDLRAAQPDLIIATPGRLNSLCGRVDVVVGGEQPSKVSDVAEEQQGEQQGEVQGGDVVVVEAMGGIIKLDRVCEIVIDEADMMLALGFQDDLSWFAQSLNSSCTVGFRLVLTSATWEEQTSATSMSLFETISSTAVNQQQQKYEPVLLVADGAGHVVTKNVTQSVQVMAHKGAPRLKALVGLLSAALKQQQDDDTNNARMIVFCLHKAEARQIGKDLQAKGIANVVLEGDMSQSARAAAILTFRRGTQGKRVLVATDVAARGLDVLSVSHVFNYSVGLSIYSYIHRCGRTGRAGRFGVAHTFVVQGLDEKFTPELCTVLRQADQVISDDLRILATKELKRRQRHQTTTAATDGGKGGDDVDGSDDDAEEVRRANRAKQLRKNQEQHSRGGGGTKKKGLHNRRGR